MVTLEQLHRGEFIHVPYLIGTNTDEGTIFVPPGQVNTDADFRDFIRDSGASSDAVSSLEQLYLTTDTPNGQWTRASDYVGDHHFTAARRLVSELRSAHGLPAYSYRFNVLPNGNQASELGGLGVSHFSEVAITLNNVHGLGYTVPPMAGMPDSYVQLSNLIAYLNSVWNSSFGL